MDRETLLDGLFQHLWPDRQRADLLIRDVLVGLINMLEREGCDFSKLEGHEDLAMWIAHSYGVGVECFTREERESVRKAVAATFPEITDEIQAGTKQGKDERNE